MKRNVFALLLTITCSALQAASTGSSTEATTTPTVWSLQDCIDYAHENNIQIGQSRLSIESSAIDLQAAKEQLFPSLSLGTSHDYSQSPYADDPTKRGAMYNGSYRLSASWTIFDGGDRYYGLKNSRLSQKKQQLTARETSNEIEMELLSTYLQILYARESLAICRKSLEVSVEQEERGKALLDAGSIAKSDYTQLVAQCADDRYQVVTAEAQVSLLLVEMKQLLNLDINAAFDIATPTFDEDDVLAPLPQRDSVLVTALATWPGILSTEVDDEMAQISIKQAKAGYYPTISLTAGLSSGTTNNGTAWGDQMKANFGESAGISLSLPIYDNGQTRAAVARARVEALNAAYDRQDKINSLTRTIESAYLDARSAQGQYIAAKERAAATADTYDLIAQQYELGIKNTFEMLTAQSDLLQARQEELQAKYMALLNRKLLEFYNNTPITLE